VWASSFGTWYLDDGLPRSPARSTCSLFRDVTPTRQL
jgi:hypothetical protein